LWSAGGIVDNREIGKVFEEAERCAKHILNSSVEL